MAFFFCAAKRQQIVDDFALRPAHYAQRYVNGRSIELIVFKRRAVAQMLNILHHDLRLYHTTMKKVAQACRFAYSQVTHGRAAFGAPVFAISPTTKTFGSSESSICSVLLVEIKPDEWTD